MSMGPPPRRGPGGRRVVTEPASIGGAGGHEASRAWGGGPASARGGAAEAPMEVERPDLQRAVSGGAGNGIVSGGSDVTTMQRATGSSSTLSPFGSSRTYLPAADEAAAAAAANSLLGAPLGVAAPEASLQDALAMVHGTVSEMREGLREAVSQLHAAVGDLNARVVTAEGEIASVRRQMDGGQNETLARLEEVTDSIASFQKSVSDCREEILDSKTEFMKYRDTSGFEQHVSNVLNKLQSDGSLHEELMRDGLNRVDRLEAQVLGLHGSLRETANDVILLRDGSGHGARTSVTTAGSWGRENGGARMSVATEMGTPPMAWKFSGEGKARRTFPESRSVELPLPRGDLSNGGFARSGTPPLHQGFREENLRQEFSPRVQHKVLDVSPPRAAVVLSGSERLTIVAGSARPPSPGAPIGLDPITGYPVFAPFGSAQDLLQTPPDSHPQLPQVQAQLQVPCRNPQMTSPQYHSAEAAPMVPLTTPSAGYTQQVPQTQQPWAGYQNSAVAMQADAVPTRFASGPVLNPGMVQAGPAPVSPAMQLAGSPRVPSRAPSPAQTTRALIPGQAWGPQRSTSPSQSARVLQSPAGGSPRITTPSPGGDPPLQWECLTGAAAPPPTTMSSHGGSTRFATAQSQYPLRQAPAPAPRVSSQHGVFGRSVSQTLSSQVGTPQAPTPARTPLEQASQSPASAMGLASDTVLFINETTTLSDQGVNTSLASAEGGPSDAAALAAAIHAAAWQGLAVGSGAAVAGMPAPAADAAAAFAVASAACSPSQSFFVDHMTPTLSPCSPSPHRQMMVTSNSGPLSSIHATASGAPPIGARTNSLPQVLQHYGSTDGR